MTAPNVAPVPVDPAVTAAAPGGPGAGATLPRLRNGYVVVFENGKDTQHVIAVTPDDVEIVGAYRTRELNHWMLYCAKGTADAVRMVQPKKVHVVSREDATLWVDLIAALYTRAVGS